MKQSPLWFSTYYGEYVSDDPAFYKASDIEVADYIEKNHAEIDNELKMLWQDEGSDLMDTLGDYTQYDDVQFPPGGWKKLVFKTWDLDNKHMWQKFPVTASIIRRFPDITSCFVTKLTAGTSLRLHHGETNATYRIHLGLKVPEVDTDHCAFEVKGEAKQWENGKAWGFIDAHSHRAWNTSGQDRYVLLVDVIRQEYKNKRSYVCSRVIFSHILQGIGRKFKVEALFKRGLPLGTLIFYILYLPILAGIKINNTFGILRF